MRSVLKRFYLSLKIVENQRKRRHFSYHDNAFFVKLNKTRLNPILGYITALYVCDNDNLFFSTNEMDSDFSSDD